VTGAPGSVQDGQRSSRKALLRDTVVAGSNELACTDTRLLPGALSSRLLRIRARGPQISCIRQDLSFCAALRCDSIKNAAALQ